MGREHGLFPASPTPRARTFKNIAGSTILKPNGAETLLAAPQAASSVEEAAAAILRTLDVGCLMVTRSEEGISLFYPDGRHLRFPVQSRKEVRDVTGAGDTALAMLSAAYASGVSIDEAAALSNVAASCAVERVGCAWFVAGCRFATDAQNPSGKVCSGRLFSALSRHAERTSVDGPHVRRRPLFAGAVRFSDIAALHPSRKVVACFEEADLDPRLLALVASLGQTALVVHGLDAKTVEKAFFGDHVIVDLYVNECSRDRASGGS